MMKKFLTVGLAVLALLGSGCIFSRNDYVENAEFDLELPKRQRGTLRIGVFKNLSGSDRRFLVRGGDGQVMPMEYQRWRLSPELLLQRCIYGAFEVKADNAAKTPRLNAVIYRFEFDKHDNKAHLAVDFMIPDFRAPASAAPAHEHDQAHPYPLTVNCDVAVPVGKGGDLSAARAAAMSECARLAVEKLSAAMNEKRAKAK